MVVSDGPAFTTPEEDINNILKEDLVFEVQFNILVVEEVTESAHFSASLGDSVVYVVVGR